MTKAARAIIVHDNQILVMKRDKAGQIYYTLVGGRVDDNESIEAAVVREVKEETGLEVTSHKLIFIEKHPKPYYEQYTYFCTIKPFNEMKLQPDSEEALMNKVGIDLHEPMWIKISDYPKLPFRTVQLQEAITKGLRNGFPTKPVHL